MFKGDCHGLGRRAKDEPGQSLRRPRRARSFGPNIGPHGAEFVRKILALLSKACKAAIALLPSPSTCLASARARASRRRRVHRHDLRDDLGH